ncbi:DUF1641 domain-containing protein [Sulfobacillus thermosulfidooxidans]|uniref:DUF1641 domain-containing protein n=1 Tax=Sulfobacillus thermosulfidooxidans TaxID=28034 RepID=UPI00096BC6E2|nr:DUF1641 domain-containing protein [Sulfobacillus thermosulfidooxidans]OLZ08122.1 hypothetical protein BFX05_04925 [Sulfobacillus thermosulfidooxidans]OLZ15018.1 hypothetical protein BFX06_05325 [Sulfobacillus thermosulfidooxidans]OLZ19623.1 hypothetical protein BFX07_02885 [Sulfobacillus thermosulfidooxidans]
MAQPITNIVRKHPSLDEQWDELKAQLINDKETAEALLRFARAAQDAGVLPFLTGLLEQKNSVLHILMEELNQDSVKKAINNGEQIAALLGNIPQNAFHNAIEALGQGLTHMGSLPATDTHEGMSIFQLLGSLKNPDIARGLRALLGFLEGFGQALATPKKS